VKRIPTVVTCHAEVEKVYLPRGYVQFETQVLRRLQGVVAVSAAIADELRRRNIRPCRISVIANGIPDKHKVQRTTDYSSESWNRSPVLVFVGRLVREKNLDVLIDVSHRLKEMFPEICLLIAGEGPLRKELERYVDELDLADAVRFLGFVEDVYPLLEEADCFVLPSQTEGMPMSLLEAMSCGVPIVASAVGSIPSVARDGVEAMLVKPDSREDLFQTLTRLLGDEKLRSDLGANARSRYL
jgi:glycosyltransferase involved in cell wall biosynthesis